MRFGLVGCGGIVERSHLPAMLRSDRVEVVGCADPVLGRAAAMGELARIDGDSCYADYKALLARDDVEVVSIATPPSARATVALDAAAAGKHVVCEKPFTVSLAEADSVLAAFERSGTTLAMYHNYLYYFESQLSARLISEGAIGDVVGVEICSSGTRPAVGADGFQPAWRWDPAVAGGGVTMDIGVHAFYLCELFLPEPVASVTATMRFADSGVDDHAFCQLRTASDCVARVDIAWGQGSSRFEISGTRGFISYVYDEGAGYFGAPVRAVRVGSVEGDTVIHKVPPGRTPFTREIYDDLVDTLSGVSTAYKSYGRNGRRAIEIAHAAYQSAFVEVPVRLPLDLDFPLYDEGVTPVLLARSKQAVGAS